MSAWFLLLSCASSPPGQAPAPAPAANAPAHALVEPLPAQGKAGAVRIEVENATGQPQSFEASAAWTRALAIASLDRPLGPLQLDRDPDNRWPLACDCPCDEAAQCPECEPPLQEMLVLAPGEVKSVPWNGRLQRRRMDEDGEDCFEAFPAPPGRYVLRLQGESASGRAEITLPAETVRLRLGEDVQRADCPLEPELLQRAARNALYDLLRMRIVPDRLPSCLSRVRSSGEIEVECVPESQRQAREEAARSQPCSLLAIPRGDRIALEAFLPLPSGWVGGERYVLELDADAASVRGARFEQ